MTPADPPAVGFVPQMQSTALQDKMLMDTDNQELTSCEVDPSNDITVIEVMA